MKFRLFQFLIFLIPILTYSQKAQFPSPSEYFSEPKSGVLVLGTIHFDYPNLDAIKTGEEDQLDVLSEKKQREITELIDYIKRFQPNKIAIEAWDSFKATEKLRKYKKGDFKKEKSERYQLGMRLATELDLDTLYSIDTGPMIADLANMDSTYVAKLTEDYDFQSSDPFHQMSIEYFKVVNKLPAKMNLLEYFKKLNSLEHHQYVLGSYLTGDFKLGDQRGADVTSVWWYNRNLRLFRKIQEMNTNNNDRILVIFGIDHAAILRHLIEYSPEFEFIEFDSL
ncbi:hypothetical protein FHG64_18065 [Antarcticibacterium flavum]|uniref:TraB/GumN family protein n=1 Tax=Antarcticibacterium flavum TaxID=2058175 RepID=A0A5B7X6P2_9FLAO|nr:MULTISPECIES: DUF5694 domain-containing protein [Antarcticibacterium]MCM4161775.1 hypothetical protein [Antarcticibacterium sp. W02-3]QCY71146.1 hypothetical protein FHG64_18065 [Antarcticibacterium flavum]